MLAIVHWIGRRLAPQVARAHPAALTRSRFGSHLVVHADLRTGLRDDVAVLMPPSSLILGGLLR